jgi:hypothetical protein
VREPMPGWSNMIDCSITPPNEVRVLFDGTALTFPIPVELSLADLATRLAEINAARRGRMVRVAITLGSKPSATA